MKSWVWVGMLSLSLTSYQSFLICKMGRKMLALSTPQCCYKDGVKFCQVSALKPLISLCTVGRGYYGAMIRIRVVQTPMVVRRFLDLDSRQTSPTPFNEPPHFSLLQEFWARSTDNLFQK